MSSSSFSMTSPASMTSELKGAMRANASRRSLFSEDCSMAQDEYGFLRELKTVVEALTAKEVSYERRRLRRVRTGPFAGTDMDNLPPFHDSWRPIMISWMYHVADTFRLMPIVVETGLYILDTCAWDLWNNTSSTTVDPRNVYPLMTMTALNMGVKCHETKMFPLDQLVQLLGPGGSCSSSKPYTPQDIIRMERKLLHQCGWKLHKPTTHDFLLRYVEVLKESQRDAVTGAAVLHLKRNLLWEHEAHRNLRHHTFSAYTLAYAAFLLAMEEVDLPLVDKQAACYALLEVANLSVKTPFLSEAYNWLLQTSTLQTKLEEKNNSKANSQPIHEPTNTVAEQAKAIPAHAPEPVSQPAVIQGVADDISCDTSISTTKTCANNADHLVLSFVDDSSMQDSGQAPTTIEQEEDDRSSSFMSECSTTSSEVIFCSYSSDGDAFEVIVTHPAPDTGSDDDLQSLDESVNAVMVLPTVNEESDYNEDEALSSLPNVIEDESDGDDDAEDELSGLVLTESLDEDGFEVAFQSKHAHSLSSFVVSPREVSATSLSY